MLYFDDLFIIYSFNILFVNAVWCAERLSCSPLTSEPLQKEVQSLAFIDVVSRLCSHENKTVAHQASLTEQRLTAQS